MNQLLDRASHSFDFIFTFYPKLVMESGLQPLLHPNYHHQIIYAKFKLKIYYPTLYGCLVQQCRK